MAHPSPSLHLHASLINLNAKNSYLHAILLNILHLYVHTSRQPCRRDLTTLLKWSSSPACSVEQPMCWHTLSFITYLLYLLIYSQFHYILLYFIVCLHIFLYFIIICYIHHLLAIFHHLFAMSSYISYMSSYIYCYISPYSIIHLLYITIHLLYSQCTREHVSTIFFIIYLLYTII